MRVLKFLFECQCGSMKLVLITRGRLVPRQLRAIKSTTPTALHIRIFVTANGLIGDAVVVYIK